MDRIDKILAHEGFGSRKDIKKMLRASEVLVNGTRVFDASFSVDCEKDVIVIDGEEINLRGEVYLMMNKVQGTISSNKDGEHRTVFDLLSDEYKTPYLEDRLHLIGRLDMDTEGLLLFTTDGSLTHKLISPKSHVSKTYFVGLHKTVTESEKKSIEEQFKNGIHIEREDNEDACDCLPAEITWCTLEQIKHYCINSSKNPDDIIEAALLTIYEGKYHQVKRMFSAVGNHVDYLKRISIGKLELDTSLILGQTYELDDDSLDLIFGSL
ncbi:MAG: rRNA pseudouridine synthase [Treponema sp.]|nr:rRNA pseudouridine synthase [Treponema sp.]